MNFYKRFIGDIQAKTGGLTLAEFGAYDRLLDHYYSTEQPIAAKEVHRICRAMSAAERAAVDSVLERFWTLTEGGYTQAKADEVIAKAKPLIEAARSNGKLGGRPKKETQPEPAGFSEITQGEPSSKAIQSQSQISSLRSEKEAPTELVASGAESAYRTPNCPHQDIVDLYAKHLPMLPQVAILSDVRKGHITARWKAVCAEERYTREQGLEWFGDFFATVARSAFLTGNGKPDRGTGRVWAADFDWLMLPTNFVKVVEGRYQDRRAA